MKLRIFLAQGKAKPDLSRLIEPVVAFESQVSTRNVPIGDIALWNSLKKAARIRDTSIAEIVLSNWAAGKSKEEIAQALIAVGIEGTDLDAVITGFEALVPLDESFGPQFRRTPDKLHEFREKLVSRLAVNPTRRQHEFDDDEFRLGFQRDRDRVLWSHALGRLANKTQLFPAQTDDQLRRRLRHCIEVMQLASTISTSFGLDRDLTEAGALAHDLGHCPFGHAGEHALNKTLNDIDPEFGGFNHYEHGVDVVRWLEDIYRSPAAGEIPGLNLTNETIECIIKHTYFRRGHAIGQDELMAASKHQDLDNRPCHLEGQAVRIADKISYLISDLEDGIRMNIVLPQHLSQCRLFDRPPIDILSSDDESLYECFISQRRSILKVLMEDILSASDQRLAEITSVEQVRNHEEYLIDYSEEVKEEVTEVWRTLQAGVLHKNEQVIASNMRAARIVSDLLWLYILAPNLIDAQFRRSHEGLRDTSFHAWYHEHVGEEVGVPQRLAARYFYEHVIGAEPKRQGDNWLIKTEHIVLAKDYVASMTDTRAEKEYKRHFAGSDA